MTADPRRPALRYYGGKWRAARWIAGHFPPHELYVEPFGGSAAVLLRKQRSLLEVYNDLDLEVVNFFFVLREFGPQLAQAVALTPFALREFARAQAAVPACRAFLAGVWAAQQPFAWQPDAALRARLVEAARLFYVRSHLGLAGPTAVRRGGFRRQKRFSRGRGGGKVMTPAAVSFMRTRHLRDLAQRLRGVTIDCLDAPQCIRRYDSAQTLFYVDPPYLPGTRVRRGAGYRHELDPAGHARLLRLLRGVQGQVVLSAYDDPLYDRLLSGWQRFERRARVDGAGSALELLWVKSG